MKFLQELFHGKGYIDGITIINLEGEILFTAKFNNKLGQDQGSEELVGKNFLDVYENLTPQTSSISRGTAYSTITEILMEAMPKNTR